jgi:tripartite-type tricarboxylate transporter receptor subunit TctC
MKPPRRRFLHLAAGAAVLPIAPHNADSQAYPSKQIKLVVPFPPGRAFDLVARPWAEKMTFAGKDTFISKTMLRQIRRSEPTTSLRTLARRNMI